MSRQARKRRRRRNRSGASRVVFLGFGSLAAIGVVGAIGAVAYVLSVAGSSPSLDSLQPVIAGASSQVFAADGARLGFIRSDILRTPITASQTPAVLRQATVAIEAQRF